MKHAVALNENFDTTGLFRMPWTMTDNSSTWLEITRDCDITCEYCIQGHEGEQHKSFEIVTYELEELMKMRQCDTLVIAGGEPMIHPNIVEIVSLVRSHKVKPFIITNGVELDEERLGELKRAGLFGCILHIDSGQNRPGWQGKTEKELNELRQYYADMFHKVGGVVCSFITTIVPRALTGVRDIVEWMKSNNDKVAQNIIIPVRGWHPGDPWDYYVDDKKIEIDTTAHSLEEQYPIMTAKDIYEEIKKVLPDFEFSGFLGGTEIANSPKWLMGCYLKAGKCFVGNLGPKTMELVQSMHHFFNGTYVAFGKRWMYRWLKPLLLPLAFVDKQVRNSLFRYILAVIKNPILLFRPVRAQAIIVMQPLDLLASGELDMCDGCPNKTFYNGRLVSECRMEEYLKYGKLIRHAPRPGAISTCSRSVSKLNPPTSSLTQEQRCAQCQS